MTKEELMKEMDRLFQLCYDKRFAPHQAHIEMVEAVNKFTGDTPPVQWDQVDRLTAVLYNGTTAAAFIGMDGKKLSILPSTELYTISVDPNDVELV